MKYFLLFLILFPLTIHAELRIDITQGNMDPIPVAILEFNSNDAESREISPSDPEIQARLEVGRPRLSQLYNWLYKSGILSVRKKGRTRFFKLTEKTIEVFVFDKGKKAIGPFFVKICEAVLFSIFLCIIIQV